jgi:hypothetical protein
MCSRHSNAGSSLAPHQSTASRPPWLPITITYDGRAGGCNRGREIARFERQAENDPEFNLSGQAKVPANRRWGRLTVTAVSISSESSTIHFAEPLDVVRAEFQARGLMLAKPRDRRASFMKHVRSI